ncbi:MAG: phosphopantothenoylcysteine decarboxylase [Bacteroidota bacterium]|nr:phosphopantothenoylcysteine decarboxylase [Bacteroidota bacterium]
MLFHNFQEIDIAVFAAAVADYKPAVVCDTKIKKAGDELYIKLVKNRDIAFEFGEAKRINQLSIGFALETNDEMKHAIEKLQHKNFDMVVLNSMNDAGATFEHDTNKVTILKKNSSIHRFPVKHKAEVARDIVMEAGSIILQKQFCTVERTS